MKFGEFSASVVSAAVKSAMGATIESACVMPSSIASAVCRNIVMGGTRHVQKGSRIHIGRISPQRLAIAKALANLSDREGNGYDENSNVKISEHDSITTATAPAATTAARGLGRSAVT